MYTSEQSIPAKIIMIALLLYMLVMVARKIHYTILVERIRKNDLSLEFRLITSLLVFWMAVLAKANSSEESAQMRKANLSITLAFVVPSGIGLLAGLIGKGFQ